MVLYVCSDGKVTYDSHEDAKMVMTSLNVDPEVH